MSVSLENQKYYYEMLFIIFVACLLAIGTLMLTSLVLLYQKMVNSFVKNGVYLTLIIVLLITGFVATLYWPLRDEIIQLNVGDQLVQGNTGPMNLKRNLKNLFCKNLEVKTNDTGNENIRVWIVATAPNVEEKSSIYRIKLNTDGRPIRFRFNANDKFRFQSEDKNNQINASISIFQGENNFKSWVSQPYPHLNYQEVSNQYIWSKTNLYGGTDYVTIDTANLYTIIASRNSHHQTVPNAPPGTSNEENSGIIEIDRFRYTPTHCDPIICADISLGNCRKKELLSRFIIDFKIGSNQNGEISSLAYRSSHLRIHCTVDYVFMIIVFSIIPVLIILATIMNWLRETARKNSITSSAMTVPPGGTMRQPTCAFENRSYTNY